MIKYYKPLDYSYREKNVILRIVITSILVLFLVNDIHTQVLKQMTVEPVPEDEYPTYLVRNPDEAVLIVHSLIDNLSFETNNGSIQQEHPSPGEYILHLRPGTHIMRFKAEGYSVVQKRIVIDKKSYREVRVSPAGQFGERVNLGTVEYALEPGPVIVIQDGVQSGEFTVDASGIFRLQLSQGKHSIKLVRQGSGTYEAEYEIETGETYREEVTFSESKVVELPPSGSGVLLVKSIPTDATVSVDGVKAGNTPLQVREIASGVHQIRIERLLYQPIVKQVEITANSLTTLEEELVPDYSSISILTAPSDAEVTLDGKLVGKTPYRNEAVSSGRHSLVLRKSYFHDMSLDFYITAGINVDTIFNMKPAFGSLRVTSKPDGASVYLDNAKAGVTPLIMDTLSSGLYMLRVQKERYGTLERTITISDGKQTLIDIPLEESFGTLIVDSEPSNVGIQIIGVESFEGVTPISKELSVGFYSINVVDNNYESNSIPVYLNVQDTIIVNIDSLLRKSGVLKVFTDPIEAKIYIDEEYVGLSPYVSTHPTGKYKIRADLEGFTSITQTATVKYNMPTEVDLTLTRGGSLRILVQPSDATIYINGEKTTENVIHSLQKRRYKVKVKANGYKTHDEEVVIESGIQKNINIVLQPSGDHVFVYALYGVITPLSNNFALDYVESPKCINFRIGFRISRYFEIDGNYVFATFKGKEDVNNEYEKKMDFWEICINARLKYELLGISGLCVHFGSGIGYSHFNVRYYEKFGSTVSGRTSGQSSIIFGIGCSYMFIESISVFAETEFHGIDLKRDIGFKGGSNLVGVKAGLRIGF